MVREAVHLGHGEELAYHLKCILNFDPSFVSFV